MRRYRCCGAGDSGPTGGAGRIAQRLKRGKEREVLLEGRDYCIENIRNSEYQKFVAGRHTARNGEGRRDGLKPRGEPMP